MFALITNYELRITHYELKLRLRSANGADFSAVSAINAGVFADNVFIVALGDSFNGAFRRACAAGDAFVCDLVCHNITSLYL